MSTTVQITNANGNGGDTVIVVSTKVGSYSYPAQRIAVNETVDYRIDDGVTIEISAEKIAD